MARRGSVSPSPGCSREEGYALTLAGRKLERLEAAREGLDAAIVQADVSVEEDCGRLVAEHVEIHGGLNVLVNSAGLGIAGTVGDTTTKAWDLQQAVNLRGAFLVTRAALPHLRATKGYVVNLASIAGTHPNSGPCCLWRVEGSPDRAFADARP